MHVQVDATFDIGVRAIEITDDWKTIGPKQRRLDAYLAIAFSCAQGGILQTLVPEPIA
jgi:hypothetical protein